MLPGCKVNKGEYPSACVALFRPTAGLNISSGTWKKISASINASVKKGKSKPSYICLACMSKSCPDLLAEIKEKAFDDVPDNWSEDFLSYIRTGCFSGGNISNLKKHAREAHKNLSFALTSLIPDDEKKYYWDKAHNCEILSHEDEELYKAVFDELQILTM